jgi:hypothetical protein
VIALTLTPEGVIRHLNDWRYVTFGEQDGEAANAAAHARPYLAACVQAAPVAFDVAQTRILPGWRAR